MSFDWDAHNRQQVLQGRQVLERTSASLARSNQIAIQTEEVGNEVVSELGSQREALLRTRDRLQSTNEELGQSKRILNAMKRNVLYNKFILILIIVLEILVLCGIIILKFFK